MAITVRIPTPLRQFTESNDHVELEGSTVGDVLKALGEKFPELGRRLFRDDGSLNRFVNVYLNDEDVRFLQNLDTPASETDEINIIQSVSGGRFSG